MYEDSQYEDDLEYEIPSEIMGFNITIDEINTVLDKHIDEEKVSDEEFQLIITYILQLFYRSGRRFSNTATTHEKYNCLIVGRSLELMNDMGIIEAVYDTELQEYLYKLNEKGNEYAKNIL